VTHRFLRSASILLLSISTACGSWRETGLAHVIFETDLGEIEVAVDLVRAPITAANFLMHVEAGHYDGGRFHRTVTMRSERNLTSAAQIEVIQGGPRPYAQGEPRHAQIPLERTMDTGLTHIDGAISMARDGPNTATADFFICIGAQPSLDFGGARNADGHGFAAFGRVVRGMDVVRAIQQSPVGAGERLDPPIRITRAGRLPW
jgi:peptidyl-prolyl cis-trans isomerase A (cyclophilin A)